MTKLVFDSLDSLDQNFAILEMIPDTHVWAKDASGVFVFGNQLFYQRFAMLSLDELLGKTDYDLAPAHRAERYRADDLNVLKGQCVTDRLELIGGASAVEWFVTSKWPICDPDDRIMGTCGISRHLNPSEGETIAFRELRAPIDFIRQHFAERIAVDDLASACNLSVSALERRFRKHLERTPHQYLTEVRLDNARRLLRDTRKPVGTIALETGFADHSHFTRAYKKHFGVAPSQAR